MLAMLLCCGVATATAESRALDGYRWQNRLLLVFSPDTRHAEYRRQSGILARSAAGLAERDMAILRIHPNGAASRDGGPDPGIPAATLYRDFAVDPSSFSVVLVGKDGTRKLTREAAVEARTLFDLIDSMPMRQWEMQQTND